MADKYIKKLADVLCGLIFDRRERDPQAYDTKATVRRIEDGKAYVHIPGGVDETPVDLTIDAKAGDTVQVRVSGGRAWLVGNRTAPPTDDAEAIIARTVARMADQNASTAKTTAEEAQQTANAVSGIANLAYTEAQEAKQIAGDTEQHFWFTDTGADTGAHITEVTQEEWNDPSDPNYQSGGNLLARSNGIAVRDGLTELAQFSSSQAVIGDTSSTHTVLENNALRFYDGSYTPIDITYSYNSGQDARHGTVMASHTSAWSQTSYDAKPGVASTAMAAQSSGSGISVVYVKADAVNGDTAHVEIDHQDCIKSEIDSGTSAPKTTIYGQTDTGDLSATGNIWSDGNIEADGDMNCNGNMSTNGTITSTGDIESLNGGIIATAGDFGALSAATVTTTGDASIGGSVTVGGHATPVGTNGTTTNTTATRGNSTSYAGIGLQVSLPKGVWMLTGTITFASNTTGRRAVRLTDAGTAIACSEVVSPPANGAATALHTSAVVENTTSSNRTYAMQCYQNSGSTQNVTGELRYVRIA